MNHKKVKTTVPRAQIMALMAVSFYMDDSNLNPFKTLSGNLLIKKELCPTPTQSRELLLTTGSEIYKDLAPPYSTSGTPVPASQFLS